MSLDEAGATRRVVAAALLSAAAGVPWLTVPYRGTGDLRSGGRVEAADLGAALGLPFVVLPMGLVMIALVLAVGTHIARPVLIAVGALAVVMGVVLAFAVARALWLWVTGPGGIDLGFVALVPVVLGLTATTLLTAGGLLTGVPAGTGAQLRLAAATATTVVVAGAAVTIAGRLVAGPLGGSLNPIIPTLSLLLGIAVAMVGDRQSQRLRGRPWWAYTVLAAGVGFAAALPWMAQPATRAMDATILNSAGQALVIALAAALPLAAGRDLSHLMRTPTQISPSGTVH